MTNEERRATMIADTFVQIIRDQVEAQRKAEKAVTAWFIYALTTRIMAVLSVVLIFTI